MHDMRNSLPRLDNLTSLYGVERTPAQTERYLRLADTLARQTDLAYSDDRAALRFYSAPGRTELCGNHTDHNHGRVLAAAIDLDSVAAVIPREDSKVRILSEGFGSIELDLEDTAIRHHESGTPLALVRGVGRGVLEAADRHSGTRSGAAGTTLRGFDAVMQSDVLPGSGLSSSAAFEVLAGTIISDCTGLDISPSELAAIGQYAENRYFNKPCGRMDQMASALGSAVAIDFLDPDAPRAEMIAFDPEEFGYSLVIVSTGGSHEDLTGEYAAIPSEMKAVAAILGHPYLAGIDREALLANSDRIRKACGDRAFLRAWHFQDETGRVPVIVDALKRGDIAAFLSLIRESGASSWKYLQNLYPAGQTSSQPLPVALALTESFLGGEGASRVHGGGFAGTIQAFVPNGRVAAYRQFMEPVFGPGSVVSMRIRRYGAVRIETAARSRP